MKNHNKLSCIYIKFACILGLLLSGCGGADGEAGSEAGGAGSSGFALTSSAFEDNGTLPMDYTCDGAGVSPPLAFTGVPEATEELALLMTTVAKDGLKWNWVLYHIPSDVEELAEGESGGGVAGLTSDGPNLAYSPPCSQGPGAKVYTFTAYALSAAPSLPPSAADVTGQVLTDAISDRTLAQSSISVSYTRPSAGGAP